MNFQRKSGVLLHPTSIPNQFGIGDFGPGAFRFVDFLKSAKQAYWQILPLGPTGFGDSPYQSFSAFAGNTNLISTEVLVAESLLEESDLEPGYSFENGRVNYGLVTDWKAALLKKAYLAYLDSDDTVLEAEFGVFVRKEADWLEDYTLFRAIKSSQNRSSWLDWPKSLRLRDESAIEECRRELSAQIDAERFFQFLFFRQWNALKQYANETGIRIIGDIPIFVALDSVDVWCGPEQFKLDESCSPNVVAGVPPDYFSETGQLWGNPIYDWDKMQSEGFNWWVRRVKATLELVDIVRIDHFRGFSACWEVPAEDKTAENGQWVEVPGINLFKTLEYALGELPIIAEDLGVITPDVEALRDQFDFPGMHILQYGFGGDANNGDLPHNYRKHCVVYTGTHDNNTSVGWFQELTEQASEKNGKDAQRTREHCLEYLASDGKEINWDLIRAAFASVADTAIVPMQDILGLDTKARMNLPSTTDGNWQWRASESHFSGDLAARLASLSEIFGRVG